ncbi:MAG TPA: hypothetical protein PK745_12840 [bacterium]|nr:hypothetical protein [bacterium]
MIAKHATASFIKLIGCVVAILTLSSCGGGIRELFPIPEYQIPDIINIYHEAIANRTDRDASLFTDDYHCVYDMGTPDDESDDRYCYSDYMDRYYVLPYPIYNENMSRAPNVAFSNISVNKIDENTMIWKEHLKYEDYRSYSNDEWDELVDADFVFTLRNISSEWKIAKEVRRTGALSIELETNRTHYNKGGMISIIATIRNLGPGHFTMIEPCACQNSSYFIVVRPDSKIIKSDGNFMWFPDLIKLAPGEIYHDQVDVPSLSMSEVWENIDYNDPENDFDIPGEYRVTYYLRAAGYATTGTYEDIYSYYISSNEVVFYRNE